MSEQKKQVGMVGLFDEVNTFVSATAKVRDAGYKNWDCHTPYPVHGLDQAMGLKPSPIPYITLTMGFIGVATALTMQWWMSVVDYPIRIGGKPLWSWPAFVPITFELFVLFSCVTTMACVLIFCKLGKWSSPLYAAGVMELVTSDHFAIVLDADDPNYTEEKAKKLLEDGGCKEVRPLYEEEDEGGLA